MEPSHSASESAPTVPTAELSHATPGRTRLRFRDRVMDEPFLAAVADAILKQDGVTEVRVNARTGSVLVLHTTLLDSLLSDAEAAGLFRVARQAPRAPMHRLTAALADADDRLAVASNGSFSLGTLAFIGLAAGGLFQLRAGKFLPAGMTLFNYALEVMQREANRENAPGGRLHDKAVG
ncbi:MAG: hypothetical protein RL385_2114 [Pseudomonadota bacterium]